MLEGGSFLLGAELEAIEEEQASYCVASHGGGLGNGLDALTIGLNALERLAMAMKLFHFNTYIATWLAVSAVNAKPVSMESALSTPSIGPALVPGAITPRAKTLLPVHSYDQLAYIGPLHEIVRLHVLEEGAQAHGARYKGEHIAAYGNVVAWIV